MEHRILWWTLVLLTVQGVAAQSVPATCKQDMFQCSDTQCLPSRWRCDGEIDCRDGTDELDCGQGQSTTSQPPTTQAPGCKKNSFRCYSGACIPERWRCDMDVDCVDGSDEQDCTPDPRCDERSFRCGNSACIPDKWRCDGEPDCSDHSDELHCEASATATTPPLTTPSSATGDALTRTVTSPATTGTTTTQVNIVGNASDMSGQVQINPLQFDSTSYSPNSSPTNSTRIQDLPANISRDNSSLPINNTSIQDLPANISRDNSSLPINNTSIQDLPANISRNNSSLPINSTSIQDLPANISRDNSSFPINNTSIHDPPANISRENSSLPINNTSIQDLPANISRDNSSLPINNTRFQDLPANISRDNSSLPINNTNIGSEHMNVSSRFSDETRTSPSQGDLTATTTAPTMTTSSVHDACPGGQFSCMRGICISRAWTCDGERDCPDGSDESRDTCPSGASPCGQGEVSCTDGTCYNKEWQCDGEFDCVDRSDEHPALCHPTSALRYRNICTGDEFQCDEGKCIARDRVCDGQKSCVDGSDEDPSTCPPPQCQTGDVACSDGSCYSASLTCDGHYDCEDGSDERRDMCDESSQSPQHEVRPMLIAGVLGKQKLRMIDLSRYSVKTIFAPFPAPGDIGFGVIDVDVVNRQLYWCDEQGRNIYTGYINQDHEVENPRVILSQLHIAHLTLDWVHQNLFWAHDKDGTIRVLSLDTMSQKTFNISYTQIGGIAVDPRQGWMYWTGWDKDGIKVERCGMDGSNRQVLVRDKMVWPQDMLIDFTTDRIYLEDAWPDRVVSCNLDGSNLVTVFTAQRTKGGAGITRVHVYKDRLYLVDLAHNQLQSVDLNQTDKVTVRVSTSDDDRLSGLAVFASDIQPRVFSRCGSINGGCEICLPVPSDVHGSMTFQCACPDHLYLQKDGRTCGNTNPDGPVCMDGFRLDLETCVDVDECSVFPPPCSQTCENTPGSYSCSCTYGYTLENGTECKEQVNAAFLLLAQGGSIKRVNITTTYHRTLSFNEEKHKLRHAVSLTFNVRNSTVFWADVNTRTVNMAHIEGFRLLSPTRIYQDDSSLVAGLAYDWVHNAIYWTDSRRKSIRVMTLKLQDKKYITTVTHTLGKPRAVELDISEKYIYWTDWEEPAMIGRCGMDGSNRSIIVSSMITWPNGLTIGQTTSSEGRTPVGLLNSMQWSFRKPLLEEPNYSERRLYWTDAKHDAVSSCNMDGGDRRVVIRMSSEHMFAITMFQDFLYWSDWGSSTLRKVNKRTGKNVEVINTGKGSPFDVKVFHPDRQPEASNVCGDNNGGCSHLCLPSPHLTAQSPRFLCKCPDDGLYQLSSDHKTCAGGDS
ncbi:low-density lipoprotein receptor-related protein 4-like isoform X3 [Haliotis rufescens]|uniref:low-density lipoprotein receptor-related protein 4-like isoform X3 n=1 Tax=Haliotis rufescens TaxID=6454 RepID=UPI00201F4752|nr:low-density lipoprotein receptor-related protein 4-like isoform X3 [Haliotis rufescens]